MSGSRPRHTVREQPPRERAPKRRGQPIRDHPVIATVTGVVAVMALFGILREFFTTTLPWMITFAEPVRAQLSPIVSFLSEWASGTAGTIVSVVTLIVLFWLERDKPKPSRPNSIGRISRSGTTNLVGRPPARPAEQEAVPSSEVAPRQVVIRPLPGSRRGPRVPPPPS
jgi:hypothetical protein